MGEKLQDGVVGHDVVGPASVREGRRRNWILLEKSLNVDETSKQGAHRSVEWNW